MLFILFLLFCIFNRFVCAARRHFFKFFSTRKYFFATHLTFQILCDQHPPSHSGPERVFWIWLFSIFHAAFSLFAFGALRLEFFPHIKIRYVLPSAVDCWIFFYISSFLFFAICCGTSHWSADKQQTICVYIRWKSSLFLFVLFHIFCFCGVFLFLSAANNSFICCIFQLFFLWTLWMLSFDMIETVCEYSWLYFVYFARRWNCKFVSHSRHWPWMTFL